MTPTNPGQWPEPKKPVISAFKALAIIIALQCLLTMYCIHRDERATHKAAIEVLDSMRHEFDDTLQINAGEIPEKEVEHE